MRGPTPLATSTDGLTAADTIRLPAGEHYAPNRGFSARGLYAVTVVFGGTLVDDTPVESEPVPYHFAVDPRERRPGAERTVEGAVADLNAALATLAFTPATGFSGAAPPNPVAADGDVLVGENARTTTVTVPLTVAVPPPTVVAPGGGPDRPFTVVYTTG